MRTVLVLYPGAAGMQRAQVERHQAWLLEHDLRLALAEHVPNPADAEVYAGGIVELPPPERLAEAMPVLERWCARHAVDAVLAQSEAGFLAGALLIARLGVPGPSRDAAHHCTNKYLCRSALHAAGVAVPRFRLAASAREVAAFAADAGYPVVLKAVASTMARLVTVVHDPGAVASAVASMLERLEHAPDVRRLRDFARLAALDLGCDPTRQFLVESFSRGQAVEMDGLMLDGSARFYGLMEQVLSRPPLFYIESYLLPADLGVAEHQSVAAACTGALAALGLRDSGFSIEMRRGERRAEIIEVNGRLGQDEAFGDLFQAVCGGDPALHALELALGGRPQVHAGNGVRAALAYRCHYADATVTHAPTRAELEALEVQGLRAGVIAAPGTRTHAPGHPDAYPHLAWVLAADAHSSCAAHARAARAAAGLDFRFSGPV
ncbi:MAG: ATP-grasp domain-containing protein [Planctomycetota bacterium]|nr:MAG: ATP-grasp domain-containing protein [Planctomycetota bacterium]